LREGTAQSHLRNLAGTLPAGVAPLLWRRRSSADITQSARTDPIDLPALIVAVIVIVPERVAESETLKATMMREPPAGTAEAMTAEPAA